MNIQIKQDDISCVLPVKISYEQVTALLKKQEAITGIVFSRRDPGAQYLQWTLDDAGWERLSSAVEPIRSSVQQVFESRQKTVFAAFGDKVNIAQAVLTTPSDEYIFYRQQADGSFIIALTAWGYKFPHKPKNKKIEDHEPLPQDTQEVKLCFVYDERYLPYKSFKLDGKERTTGADGLFELGTHPVGSGFTIIFGNDGIYKLQVEKGRDIYEIDITEFVTIEVVAHKDGELYADATCIVTYNGRSATLQTDVDGRASIKWPYCMEGAECAATIEGITDRCLTKRPITVLSIYIETPKPVEKPAPPMKPPKEEQPKDVPVGEEPRKVRFRLLGYKGMPLPELDFTIKTKGGVLQGKTDDNGYATFPANLFEDGEKPKIDFTITRAYKQKHDIYGKPKKN